MLVFVCVDVQVSGVCGFIDFNVFQVVKDYGVGVIFQKQDIVFFIQDYNWQFFMSCLLSGVQQLLFVFSVCDVFCIMINVEGISGFQGVGYGCFFDI